MCVCAHETDQSVQSLDALIGTDRKWGCQPTRLTKTDSQSDTSRIPFPNWSKIMMRSYEFPSARLVSIQNGPSPGWNWGHLRGTVRGRRPAQRSPKAQHIQIAIAAQYCSVS